MTGKFQVQFLEEAAEFIERLDERARDKVIYNIQKDRFSNDRNLFKKLKGEIWEFRTLFSKTHYRLFAFWDKTGQTETVVISTHGIIKKTDKTPPGEIE
jgi:phage-related protein